MVILYRYANPDLASPAVPRPLSPSPHSKVSGLSSANRGVPLPTISFSAAASLASSSTGEHTHTYHSHSSFIQKVTVAKRLRKMHG